MAAAACATTTGEVDVRALESEPILETQFAGATASRTSRGRDAAGPTVTRLMEVVGDWDAVSVAIARAVREHGWAVETVNCVGSGNDVIAKKLLGDTWVLLESGAGTRGAGIILRIDPDQRPPGDFTVTGPCSPALVAAASS